MGADSVTPSFSFVPSRLRWRLRAATGAELTRAQRAELVAAWLRIAPSWSDRSIAAECGVSHQTVGRLRTRLDHSSGTGDDDRIRMVGPFSAGFSDPADGGRRHDAAMAILEIEREVGRPFVVPARQMCDRSHKRRRPHRRPDDGLVAAVYGGTPEFPASHFVGYLDRAEVDARFASGALFGVTIRKERHMTNQERIDRLERALSIRAGINLELYGAGPSAVSPAPVVTDEVEINPVAA